MIILLSPAKTFKEIVTPYETCPHFLKQATSMMKKLSKISLSDLASEMKISLDLAIKVKQYTLDFNNIKSSAIFTYYGYAYQEFDAPHMDDDTKRYMTNHLYILSGLYGIVRPYDGICFYRLEMKDRLLGNLYDYWKPKIADFLLKMHPNQLFINLASVEYSQVLPPELNMITLSFYELIDTKLKQISMHVKSMRGKMANYLLTHKVDHPEHIKEICIDGFLYDPIRSTDDLYVFIKEVIK